MKYCSRCLMPDTRPGISFADGVCAPCINYDKQMETNWSDRWSQLEELCDKHRGCNGNGYDCAIAVSGGKDSHFQVKVMKEDMGMNPVLLSVGNVDWTETGRSNLSNLSDAFSCDIISHLPNVNVSRTLALAGLTELGSPTWYADALIYAYPYRMAMQLGLDLLVYGENVNYTYGGKYNEETPSAKLQPLNDVVKKIDFSTWIDDWEITSKELYSAMQPDTIYGFEPIYLSYFVPWDSDYNYQVARRYGFKQLSHEYVREGTIEQYNQIDSIGYLLNQWLKYPKFGHASATEMASRWIRAGKITRAEAIPLVKKHDKILDQGIIENFCSFCGIKPSFLSKIIDEWYNPDLFEQDKNGIWHEKFEVGK